MCAQHRRLLAAGSTLLSVHEAPGQVLLSRALCPCCISRSSTAYLCTNALPLLCLLGSCSADTDYVSEVANGGQVLLDEQTFRQIKHHLSTLGTVDENGYNHRQLQQRLHAEVVAKMRRRVAYGTGCCR